MNTQKTHSLYSEQVIPFLRYRVGGELASQISRHVLAEDLSTFGNERDGLMHQLQTTLDFTIGEDAVLKLVLENTEYSSFTSKFLAVFDQNVNKAPQSSFNKIFDTLVAGYLEDILGKELMENVKNVFIKAVSAIPDQPVDVRFYIGMQAIYKFIPDVWGEVEFADKVKDLSRLLPDDMEKSEDETQNEVKFEDLVEKIIISDLVDILGKGHALETVLEEASKKNTGIFYNDHDRFVTFVSHVLEDNFISRMFDSYWVEEKREKWLNEVEVVLGITKTSDL